MLKLGAKKTKLAHKYRTFIFFVSSMSLLVLLSFVGPNTKVCAQNSDCFLLDIANTESSRELGLSGRSSIAQNGGMIFEFDEVGKYCFWMKDMKFPLDIIWLDSNKKIIKIEKDAIPESYPEQFCADDTTNYVIELNSGQSAKNNLLIGQKLEF